MASSPRKKISAETETQMLMSCGRRCCLCFFLEGNTGVRDGQIAHIDGASSNNKADNLVWLCLEHHNQYDSRTSQTKNITPHEIKKYRSNLHDVILKKNLVLQFSIKENPLNSKNYLSNGNLIGLILETYDRELANLERNSWPNGIKLCNLATIAATEEGDFFAARQALLSILRLGGECEKKGLQRGSLSETVPTANLLSAGEKILECFSHIDFGLCSSVIYGAGTFVIRGDTSFIDFAPSMGSPTPAFYFWTQMLCRIGRKEVGSEGQSIANIAGSALGKLALSAAMLLRLQDIAIPPPPEERWVNPGGDRIVPLGEDERLKPLFWVASRIAYLAEPAYQAALEELKSGITTGGLFTAGVGLDKENGFDSKTLSFWLRKWMAFPNSAFITVPVKSEKDIKPVEAAIAEFKSIGINVAQAAYEFVIKERELEIQSEMRQRAQSSI